MKALGVGLGAASWHEIEVVRDDDGVPVAAAHRRPPSWPPSAACTAWHLTLTHSDTSALATVVALAPAPPVARPSTLERAGTSQGPPLAGVLAGGLVPIVTPEEMGAIDGAAPEPVEVLIGRAGAAIARAAVRLLGRHLRPAGRGAGRQGEQRQRRS